MYKLTIIFLLTLGTLFAQQNFDPYHLDQRKGNVTFSQGSLIENGAEEVQDYLLQNLSNLKLEGSSIELLHQIWSQAAEHYLFQQKFNGTPIFNAYVKTGVNNKQRIYFLADYTTNNLKLVENTLPSQSKAMEYLAQKNIEVQKIDSLEIKATYFPTSNGLIPALQMLVSNEDEAFRVVLNSDGEEIYREDLIKQIQYDGKDSLVNALVFLPDPLTSAKVSYGSPYVDMNDASIFELNNEMVNVQVVVDYENGVFSLEGDYVKITNYKNTSYSPATSTVPFFNYNRADQEFEDINVYYHITTFQEYVQSLGFNNLANYTIHAETHAYSSDNSTFVGTANPPRINFGEGGVDDAEDADVIIHEYLHALEQSASPEGTSGFERKGISEGTCDYFAVSYSRSIDDFQWENVFSWDGHNEFYAGRTAKSNKTYPNDLVFGSYHDNAEIWSSALMDIWEVEGQQVTDKIVLESMYDYTKNSNMSEAAMAVIMADSNLYNGDHFSTICAAFNKRGFSTICNGFSGIESDMNELEDVKLLNTEGFAGGSFATLQILTDYHSAVLVVSDVTGKVITEKMYSANAKNLKIHSRDLTAGIYFLNVLIDGKKKYNFKLVKAN